jgi:hypothetical protein
MPSIRDRGPVICPPGPLAEVRQRRLAELINRFEQCLTLAKDQRADHAVPGDLLVSLASGAGMETKILDSVNGECYSSPYIIWHALLRNFRRYSPWYGKAADGRCL